MEVSSERRYHEPMRERLRFPESHRGRRILKELASLHAQSTRSYQNVLAVYNNLNCLILSSDISVGAFVIGWVIRSFASYHASGSGNVLLPSSFPRCVMPLQKSVVFYVQSGVYPWRQLCSVSNANPWKQYAASLMQLCVNMQRLTVHKK